MRNDKKFLEFKKKCSKTGTTEESIAQAEKIGFKTDLTAVNPFDEKITVPIYFRKFCINGLWIWGNFWLSSS